MTGFISPTRKLSKLVFNTANVPAFVALMVILAGAVFAENLNCKIYQQRARAELLHSTNLIASRIQGVVTSNIALVQGLASTIATEPDMDQQRFATLAKSLFQGDHQLDNIGGAPNLVMSLMYPVSRNREEIGFDLRTDPAQRAAALFARDTGKTVLAGPMKLNQGQEGFIARIPVFIPGSQGAQTFWGVLSSIISKDKIYSAVGLDGSGDIIFALHGKNASGPAGALFLGPEFSQHDKPVKVEIDLGVGSWELSALPKGGWQTTADNAWLIRLVAGLAALVVVIPFSIVGWLFRERSSLLGEHIRSRSCLARITERLELALETSQIGVWEFDVRENVLHWDPRMRELYGYSEDRIYGYTDWADRIHPRDRKKAIADFQDVLDGNKMYYSEYRVQMPNGRNKTIRTIGSATFDEHGVKSVLGVNWDISADVNQIELLSRAQKDAEHRYLELEIAKSSIESNSLHDFLTELPNRRYLDEKLQGRVDFEFKLDATIGLLKIDLDGFKEVNDSLGHAAGDAMLVHTANVLRGCVRKEEFIARIGGDEFVVVCKTAVDANRLEDLADDIIKQLKKPVDYQGRECQLGASIGIAHGASADGNADKLLSHADLALYKSKQDGKGCKTFYTGRLHQIEIDQRTLADDIMRGIENREFVPYFQGQFDARTHILCGAEALARWEHPKKGILPPSVFLDVAESLNVMGTIDAMILEKAIVELGIWRLKGLKIPRISVNVSPKRLGDKDLINHIKTLDFDPSSVTFELVESTFLDKSDAMVAWNIDQIRNMGMDIEIDDFGTAYASIVSLTQLLPTRLKIDRQLVSPTVGSKSRRELVQSIVDIGHSLDIGVVAEGVETMQHATVMRELGCDILQGFAFARPVSSQDFLRAQLPQQKLRNIFKTG